MPGGLTTRKPGPLIDVAVVIDVIRAFTTASVLFARGAAEVVCARDQSEAARIDRCVIAVGETADGTVNPGVIPNSPVDVSTLNVKDRRVALFTLNGTRSLHAAPACTVLMAAAAANARATAEWILTHVNSGCIHLIVSDRDGPEDYACARYLAGLLAGARVDPAVTNREIMAARWAHWGRWGANVNPAQWRRFEADVDICARVDTHPIAMIADTQGGRPPTLRAVSPDGFRRC